MLSYQHGYHAGNFADIIKHLTLARLLTYMTLKEKPMFFLETHSGRGAYDLQDNQAIKTGEAREGIEHLWDHRDHLPAVFSPYLQSISQLNHDDALRYYPGSPSLAMHILRHQDLPVFCELHPGEFKHLQRLPHRHPRVLYRHCNGLEQLKALLPPIQRRGLIFIDPSYEIKTDYHHIPELLKNMYPRFSTGVYCLWYPIIDHAFHAQLLRGLKNIGAENNLRIEFYLTKKLKQGMTGCGLWIINPPHVLLSEMTLACESLSHIFHPGASSYLIQQEPSSYR
jgi:23S rRNA (adenine2030-N6)-methyltransferase